MDGVIDAETIKVSDGRGSVLWVRLIGVYAPSVGKPGEDPECGAEDAAALVAELLPVGAPVYLVSDSLAQDKDAHGQLLRCVETADGTDIGHLLLSEGLGVRWTAGEESDFDRSEDYNHTTVIALDHNRGSWSSCDVQDFPPQRAS